MSEAISTALADAVVTPAAPPAAPPAPAAESKAPEASKPEASKADAPKADGAKSPEKLTPAEKAAVKQMFKIVVDGKEEEVDADEYRSLAQKGRAADKRFQEGAQARKEAQELKAQVNQVLELMSKSPREFAQRAKALGVDPEQFAVEILKPIVDEQIRLAEEQTLTPEQKKQRETERELADYKRREVEAKQKAEAEAKQKAEAEHKVKIEKIRDNYSQVIQAALEKTVLEKTHENALALLELIEETSSRGLPLEPVELARALEQTKWKDVNAVLKNSKKFDALDPEVRKRIRQEALEDPEIAEAIRKKAVDEYKKANPMVASSAKVGKLEQREDKRPPKTYGSVMRDLQMKRI